MTAIMSGLNIFYQNQVVILICLTNINIIRCKKTKIKQKIIAIWKILLLTAIPNIIDVAGETSVKEGNNETALVNFTPCKSNIFVSTNRIFSSRRFIGLLYLKIMLNNKILLYNESYI